MRTAVEGGDCVWREIFGPKNRKLWAGGVDFDDKGNGETVELICR
jgi:hypothetical protein